MPTLARYAALLRGVSPLNAKMPALEAAFEGAGFKDVKTVLGSGNVLFSAPASSAAKLAQKAEAAMARALPRSFLTIVEPVEDLRALLADDPWKDLDLPAKAKRVVTFLREKPGRAPLLPISQDGATIYHLSGTRVLSAYVVNEKGPVFMTLLKKTFGDEITTRTWDTVKRLAA